MSRDPIAFFITFRTYGTWLPGDERGYTHHTESSRGAKQRLPSKGLQIHAQASRASGHVELCAEAKRVVDRKVREVCDHYGWKLIALNVRTNHVHVVVHGDKTPERMMNAFKSWCTKRLREEGLMPSDARVWSRHGSTKHLYDASELAYAEWYTNEGQSGERYTDD